MSLFPWWKTAFQALTYDSPHIFFFCRVFSFRRVFFVASFYYVGYFSSRLFIPSGIFRRFFSVAKLFQARSWILTSSQRKADFTLTLRWLEAVRASVKLTSSQLRRRLQVSSRMSISASSTCRELFAGAQHGDAIAASIKRFFRDHKDFPAPMVAALAENNFIALAVEPFTESQLERPP